MGWFNEHFWNPINNFGNKVFGNNSWYAGTNGVFIGDTADQVMSQKLGGYNYGNARGSTTNAYKANAAGTANKIAQGGMTKDDILKYNAIHPNEIAGDNPANTTALNTNTALRSK